MRLLSWNIQWGRGADGRVDLARTADLLRRSGADLICLQEVAINFPALEGNDATDQFAWLMAALPGHQAFFAPACDVPAGDGGRSRFGNMLLSNRPVQQVFRHSLPWPADPGKPSMQRVCLEAVVDDAAGPLRVMTTHLEYYSARQRRAQIAALRRLYAEGLRHARSPPGVKERNPAFGALPRGCELLVCGDFNFASDSVDYRALLRSLPEGVPALRDAWTVCHGRRTHEHTVGLHGAEWPDSPYCCDFAFVTPGLAARLTQVRVEHHTAASDHQPLIVEWV